MPNRGERQTAQAFLRISTTDCLWTILSQLIASIVRLDNDYTSILQIRICTIYSKLTFRYQSSTFVATVANIISLIYDQEKASHRVEHYLNKFVFIDFAYERDITLRIMNNFVQISRNELFFSLRMRCIHIMFCFTLHVCWFVTYTTYDTQGVS